MNPNKCQEKCCIIKCTNTSSNRNVKFFSFLEGRLRPCQREKWLQAIQKENGQGWSSIKNSRICSEHFVLGRPSKMPQDTDYVPTVFKEKKTVDGLKSRPISLKRFALEYMKHEDLLEKPSRASINTKRRKAAYVRLAAALGVPVVTARAWEQRFRQHVEKKLADPDHKRASSADGTPHWMTTVEKQLYSNHMHRVLAALCAAARARRMLCGAPLYRDVRRTLHLAGAVSDLHAVWVSAQRVSLEQVRAAGRAGDAAPLPHQEVADLVLLHTDVDVHRLVTDESVTLYEESSALHTLWQLVQQHRLEDDAGPRRRAQRWSRAYRDYQASGRFASIVVLQRRWHELKLQARVRLAAHWRRPMTSTSPAPPDPHPTPPTLSPTSLKLEPVPPTLGPTSLKLGPVPPTLGPTSLKLDHAPSTLDPATPTLDPAPPTVDHAPHELYPRPTPLHIAILKRYPLVATGPFKCWRELVQAGFVIVEPLEEDIDMTDTQSQDSEVSSVRCVPVNDPAGAHLYPNLSKVEHAVDDPHTERTGNVLLKHCLMNDIDKQDRGLLTGQRKVNHPKIERADDDLFTPKIKVNEFKFKQHMSNDLLVARSSVTVRPCFEDNSNDEIVPKSENCSDLDAEDNLVIDEFSNMAPYFKQEAVTETHSVDTVSPHTTLEDTAPTIEVLNTIDPSTVKKEILFESDEDDFQPFNEDDKAGIKLEIEEEAPRLSNRIMFTDEEPAGRCDVTDRVECGDEEHVDDSDGDTPIMDPKLLMDTTVPLFRIDKTRAWRNNVRKDKSIRVSRIHRRYYTPKWKPNMNGKQETRARKSCLNKTQEIRVDQSCLEKVANTHSIKQLCMNIKREMIDELDSEGTPNKKVKVESDSDEDEPLTVLKRKKDVDGVKQLADESNSDDERANEEMMYVTRARLGARSNTAATTVPRRVTLPQRRAAWSTRDTRVAQVAPITSAPTRGSASGEDVATAQLPVVAADDDTPLAWCPLDLPAGHELQAALNDLALAASVEQERRGRQHCCAARRQREVNDTRRRLGLPPINLHTHADDACDCCCAHLSDMFARRRLSAQLRALHHDIERMLCLRKDKKTTKQKQKTAEGTVNSKPKNSRSPSPEKAKKPLTAKDSSSVSKVKRSKAKSTNQSKQTKKVEGQKRRKHRRVVTPPAPDTPPAPPLNDYEEWQRQKNLNSQYFHINGSIKKDKSAGETTTTSIRQKGVTLQSITQQNINAQSITPLYAMQQNVTQECVTPQNVTQQNVTPQSVTLQNVTLHNVTQQCITPLYVVQPSVTQQIITPQNVQQSVIKQSNVAPIKSSPGLPYESRLATPAVPNNIVKRKPRPKKKDIVKPAQRPGPAPTTTTEQPATPLRVTSEPAKPVSLLEEYSRTLTAPPGSVSALALQVPGDTQHNNTTIVMAVTLPSDAVIHNIGLYPKDTVDLTDEVPASVDNQKKTPVVDFVGAVKNLMGPVDINACKQRLLQRLHNDAGRSLLKTNNKHTAPSIMSLCKPLQHGDVIEIEDSDSDEGTDTSKKINDSSFQVKQTDNKIDYEAETSNIKDTLNRPNTNNTKNNSIEAATNITNNSSNENEINNTNNSSDQAETTNTQNNSNEVETINTQNNSNEVETINTQNNSNEVKTINTQNNSNEVETINTQNNSNEVETINTQNNINETESYNTQKSTNEAESSNTQNDSNQATSLTEVSINQAAKNDSKANSSDKVADENCQEVIELHDSEQSSDQAATNAACEANSSNKVAEESCEEVIAVQDSEQSSVQATTNSASEANNSDKVADDKVVIAVQDSEQSSVQATTKSASEANNSNKVADESCEEVIAVQDSEQSSVQAATNAVSEANSSKKVADDSCEEVIAVQDSEQSSVQAATKSASKANNSNKVADDSCQEVIELQDSEQSVPLLPPPTNRSARCRCRRVDVAAIPRFMRELRLANKRAHEEKYTYKIGATHVAAGALPCGGTLLCVDGARAPLALRGHLVLTRERPCQLPTYWTLQNYGRVKRVVPHETAACHTLAAHELPDAADVAAVAADRAARGLSPLNIRLADDLRLVCQKKHEFQILTALTSIQEMRRAVQWGERLLLLHRQRARMFALVVRRHTSRGSVRYRASANVDPLLVKELEAMLNDAEMDEELRVLVQRQRRRLASNNTMQAVCTDDDVTVSTTKEGS